MREAGRIVAQVLEILAAEVRPGLNVRRLDEIVREEYRRRNVIPTFLGYAPGNAPPYPATVCVSINDQIVHGIPRDRILQEGDIVSIDLGATYKGFVGDAAITVPCGNVSPEAMRLIEATKGALWAGINAARPAAGLGDSGGGVRGYAKPRGFGGGRVFGGHAMARHTHGERGV